MVNKKNLSGALRTNRNPHVQSKTTPLPDDDPKASPQICATSKEANELGESPQQISAIQSIAASINAASQQARRPKGAVLGQFVLAFVSVVAGIASIWNTKLTNDSIRQLEEQRLANYRPSITITPLEISVTARRNGKNWKIDDRSENSKVRGEEGPIKVMQLANVGKGAIEGLTFSWSYPKVSPSISMFGVEVRNQNGQPVLFVNGQKFLASWIQSQPSIVLASENEIKGVDFVADPIQFEIFDKTIENSLKKNIIDLSVKNFEEMPLTQGETLLLKYRNIEGSIYSQKFNFYFQPHNYEIHADEHGMINFIRYDVTVLAEPDGIEPVPRHALSLIEQ